MSYRRKTPSISNSLFIGPRTEVLPDRVVLYTDDGDAAASEVHQRGVVAESMLVRRSTLEDAVSDSC